MLLYTSFFGNVGGLPPAPAPGADYFAANGATFPVAGSTTDPPAFYDATTDKTWFVWEALTAEGRTPYVTNYDHATGKWSPFWPVRVGNLTDDSHGVPSIVRDAGGYIHVFYGGHNSAVFESVSVSPDTGADGFRLINTFSGGYTYPKPMLVGSALYLFMRLRRLGNNDQPGVIFKTTSISSGVSAWGAQQLLVNFGNDTRTYLGTPLLVGTDIHFVGTRADYADSFRRDIYHFIYETTTGNVKNAGGSTTVLAANLPVDLTTADASFRVVNTGTDYTNGPAFCIDTSGDLHLAYPRGASGPYSIFHTKFASGSWASPVDTGFDASHRDGGYVDMCCLAPLASAEIALYWSYDPTNAWSRGGDMMRSVRSAGGVWGSSAVVVAATSHPLELPGTVRSGLPAARVVFAEVVPSDLDSSGGALKVYAHGDNGFLQRQPQAPTDIKLSSTKVVAGVSTGTVIGQLHAVDTDYGDTFTWSINSDPDGKFAVSGNELETAASISYPNSHSVTIRATDSFGNVKTKAFTITVVQTQAELNDSFYSDVDLVITKDRPHGGTDASYANVKLLIDGT